MSKMQHYHNHMGKLEQIKYECTICGKSSDSKISLSVHIKQCTDRFPCQSYSKILTSKSSIYNQRIHMGQEDTCKKCQKSLKSRNHIWIMYLMATLMNL